jgi:hypothetical protein
MTYKNITKEVFKEKDALKLIEMVKNNKHISEIMKEFDFKNTEQLKSYYINALIETGSKLLIKNKENNKSDRDSANNIKKFNITFNKIVEIDMEYYEDNKDEYFSFLDFIVSTECNDWIIEEEWKIEELN